MIRFRVDCSCGQHLSVSEGAAGAKLRCECGRDVTVPGLNELLARAELPPHRLSPELMIEHMIATGALPDGDCCVECGRDTPEHVVIIAECERVWVRGGEAPLLVQVLWNLFLSPLGIFAWQGERYEAHGNDTILPLPLRICGNCCTHLRSDEALRRYLRKTPVYADLLDKFPKAKLSLSRPR
jgi:hypothetical protein